MTVKKYYSARKEVKKIDWTQLDIRFEILYKYFKERNYFKDKANIKAGREEPEALKSKAWIEIGISPFPLDERQAPLDADHIFDLIEFFYDHVSKPSDLDNNINTVLTIAEVYAIDEIGVSSRNGKYRTLRDFIN